MHIEINEIEIEHIDGYMLQMGDWFLVKYSYSILNISFHIHTQMLPLN